MLKISSLWGYSKRIYLYFVKMHPYFHLIYGILISKYKNVMITLQKGEENPRTI